MIVSDASNGGWLARFRRLLDAKWARWVFMAGSIFFGCTRYGDESARNGRDGPAIDPPSYGAVDLAGSPVDPCTTTDARAVVLVFIRNDCPISNRYAPEIVRLQTEFGPRGVRFWLVHPTSSETPEAIRKHAKEYGDNAAPRVEQS